MTAPLFSVDVGGDNDDALELTCMVCRASVEVDTPASMFELLEAANAHTDRRHSARSVPSPWPPPYNGARWVFGETALPPEQLHRRTIMLRPPVTPW